MPRAARFYRPARPLVLENVGLPKLSEHEILIRVQSAGICHTDVDMIDNGMTMLRAPVTLGHEISGIVEEVGTEVRTRERGDRVLVHSWTTCGNCQFCNEGKDMLCQRLFTSAWYGFNTDGGFAEYCKVEANQVLSVPYEIPLDFASTLGCAGLTAYHAVSETARISSGDNVVMFGMGGVALYAVQFAKLRDANLIAISRSEKKLKAAEDLGAAHLINAQDENISSAILAATKGKGADVIFSFAPQLSNGVLPKFVGSLSNGGKIILVGSPEAFSIDPSPFIFRGVSLSGSHSGSKRDLVETLELARNQRIKSIATEKIELERINEALDSLRRGEIVGRCTVAF